MQIRPDGRIAVIRQLAGVLLRRLVPAGHVMDHHDPGVRAGSRGARQVGIDRVALVAAHLHDLRTHGLGRRPRGRLRGLRLRVRRRKHCPCRTRHHSPHYPGRSRLDEIPPSESFLIFLDKTHTYFPSLKSASVPWNVP